MEGSSTRGVKPRPREIPRQKEGPCHICHCPKTMVRFVDIIKKHHLAEMPSNSDLEKNDHISSNQAQIDKNAYLVRFNDGAPDNPKNFHPYYKAWLTWEMGMLAFVGSLGSSIMSPAEEDLANYLGVSKEATVLTLSLFVLGASLSPVSSRQELAINVLVGYAFGPLVWAPISEVYGRRWSMLPPVFVLGLLSIGTAVSKNATSVFITRFLGGLFGSAPISNVSAALGDIYDPRTRGVPMAFLALCVVGGPTIAPVVGASLTVNPGLGWRCMYC